ncbi:MAG: peptide chain release factor N(5)-glutamine methyltransferase [Acetatifactor sp.]|nr:peptide chain release factor N(5)-glutamine methyltransferase [Acetatifactor sp.]
MTYQECYDWGKETLEQAEISEAALDARLLLEHVFLLDLNGLLMRGAEEADDGNLSVYQRLIHKRTEHTPLQHLTGLQNFMGLDFKVNEHVLVPRQDTETLVEEVLRELSDGMRILDMCTGSGCILISLLHYTNDCQGVGVDISQDALAVARENAESLLGEKAESVVFLSGDLFEPVSGKFEFIVSNPPYIASEVISTLMPEVRAHEPIMALDGGEDGLRFYRRISEESKKYLKNGGMLYFEIGHDQADAVSELMESMGFREIRVVKDLAGLDRVVYGTYIE